MLFHPNATAGLEVQQQILPSPPNTSPDSPKNTVYFSVSLFSLSSVSLSCFLSSSLSSPLSCRSASFNPLLSVSFLSEFLSPSSRTPDKTDESGTFPHCTQRWMTAVLNGIVCVFFLPLHESIFFFFLSSAIHFFFSLCRHLCTQNLTVSTVAPCLSVSIFPLFRDIQSSASKLGYSMPLPNCPTASGSDRSGYAERGLQPAFKSHSQTLAIPSVWTNTGLFSCSTYVSMCKKYVAGIYERVHASVITEGQVYSFLSPCSTLTHSHGHTCLHPFTYLHPSLLFSVSASSLLFSHPSPFLAAQEAKVKAKAVLDGFSFPFLKFLPPLPCLFLQFARSLAG